MQKTISITELDILHSHMSFTLPLRYDSRRKDALAQTFKKNKYSFFRIDELAAESKSSGNEITVNGKELEQYFLPYIENKLFPAALNEKGFHRFTKEIQEQFEYKLRNTTLSFIIQIVDIILGPFDIVFLTVKVQLDNQKTELADVLDFMHHFRAVEPKLEEEQGMIIVSLESGEHLTVQNLLFEYLCPFLKEYILHDDKLGGSFGSLPYYEDERMYVTAFLFSREVPLLQMTNCTGWVLWMANYQMENYSYRLLILITSDAH